MLSCPYILCRHTSSKSNRQTCKRTHHAARKLRPVLQTPRQLPDSGTYESSYFTTEISPQEAAQQSGITITWHDAQGQTWISNLRPQWNNYFFNIYSAESYKTNENNIGTLQLRIRYKCQLFNEAQPDRSRWIEGEGVIGVGR